MAGKIIVIEGTEQSCKEEQSDLLMKKLIDNGKKCIKFEFPMYDTPTGKIVDMANISKNSNSIFPEGAMNVDPYVISLYYAADRKYNMPKINKYLEKDFYVILDRYVPSNLAFQGSKIKDKDKRFEMYQWIDKLEYWLLRMPKPDKTIFLKVPYDYIINNDKSFENDINYLKDTEDSYIELSELYNWDRIECVINNEFRNEESICNDIYDLIIKMEN